MSKQKTYPIMACPDCEPIRTKDFVPEYGEKYICSECDVVWSRNKPTKLCIRCNKNTVTDRVPNAKICSMCFVIAMETLFAECQELEEKQL